MSRLCEFITHPIVQENQLHINLASKAHLWRVNAHECKLSENLLFGNSAIMSTTDH